MAIDRDLELMLRVRQGDAESFEQLLSKYRTPLVHYFTRMVADRALAEDLAQEAFLRVYRARERYQAEAKFTTWLYRIATRLALNALRDRRAKAATSNDLEQRPAREAACRDLSIEQQLMESDRQRLIRKAVEALPDNQRAAVILHKYQEADYRQISKVLEVSESAVKSLLFRAYQNLRVSLEPLVKGGQI